LFDYAIVLLIFRFSAPLYSCCFHHIIALSSTLLILIIFSHYFIFIFRLLLTFTPHFDTLIRQLFEAPSGYALLLAFISAAMTLLIISLR
jgi:hypothetical protein